MRKESDIMLPKDVHMLVSFLNTKLRDDDMSLEHIIEVYGEKQEDIMSRIKEAGYTYDAKIRQIKQQ